jgi:hypothetical protein
MRSKTSYLLQQMGACVCQPLRQTHNENKAPVVLVHSVLSLVVQAPRCAGSCDHRVAIHGVSRDASGAAAVTAQPKGPGLKRTIQPRALLAEARGYKQQVELIFERVAACNEARTAVKGQPPHATLPATTLPLCLRQTGVCCSPTYGTRPGKSAVCHRSAQRGHTQTRTSRGQGIINRWVAAAAVL